MKHIAIFDVIDVHKQEIGQKIINTEHIKEIRMHSSGKLAEIIISYEKEHNNFFVDTSSLEGSMEDSSGNRWIKKLLREILG